ncbi:MAG: hypothetical protein J6Y03_02450 [Alphaproteobacteria bacterium]|nr:hypothetical protein [Alphaproteobacteria bacterium]
MAENKKKKPQKKRLSKEAKREMAEAELLFICRGYYGFNCGTEDKGIIAKHRREKTWEEVCKSFHEREGD